MCTCTVPNNKGYVRQITQLTYKISGIQMSHSCHSFIHLTFWFQNTKKTSLPIRKDINSETSDTPWKVLNIGPTSYNEYNAQYHEYHRISFGNANEQCTLTNKFTNSFTRSHNGKSCNNVFGIFHRLCTVLCVTHWVSKSPVSSV